MGEPQERYHLRQQGEFASSKVLSDFYVNSQHYVIICPESHYESFTEQNLSDFAQDLKNEVVGRLRLNHQLCIIIEVKSDGLEDRKSEITTLLTERELEIVLLVAQGYSNKQVAHRLRISEWTVSTHLRRVFAKLSVDSRAAMVYRCSSLLNNLEQLVK